MLYLIADTERRQHLTRAPVRSLEQVEAICGKQITVRPPHTAYGPCCECMGWLIGEETHELLCNLQLPDPGTKGADW